MANLQSENMELLPPQEMELLQRNSGLDKVIFPPT